MLLFIGPGRADWPMFGRDSTRNPVSPEKGTPIFWRPERRDDEGQRIQPALNVRWTGALGSLTAGDPVVANGLVWVGTNNRRLDAKTQEKDASVLLCFRESDGRLLYRYVSPRLSQGVYKDWAYASLASSPLIEGDRLWFATNRCETVCLDIGPLRRGEGEPRVLWKVDMMKELDVFPRTIPMGVCHMCSVAAYQDYLYVITSNGTDEDATTIPKPEAPSLVCFRKDTGKVVWQDNSPGANILDGQWASPLVVEIGGRGQVIAPQGDGWLRAFDAKSGKLIWKFDMNFKTAVRILGGRGDRNDIPATPVF
jgi:outer membrane protein assembly factor BamB